MAATIVWFDEGNSERLNELLGKAIIDSAADAIVSKDMRGIIRSWNAGAERLFGYSVGEAVGRPVTMLIPPEAQDEETHIMERLRRGERIEHFETVRVTKDGRRIPISLTVSPIVDTDGRIIGASKIARDISERKRMEAAMTEAERRKDEFLAMLAHELRNPMTPIKTALEIMQNPKSDPARREWGLQVIDRQVTQLTRIIDDLLELGRIAHGRFFLRKESTTLRAVVAAAVETTRPLVQARRHVLRVELPTADVALYVDPVRMAQALSNLLHNAAKFTEPGGTILVDAALAEQTLELRVKDSGRGVDPEVLPTVFDMFVQGRQDLARTEGGLGVGLSVVRQIVELHDGSVRVRSDEGRGSEFIVTLPLVKGPARTPAMPAPTPAPDIRRILVIDDNRDVTDALAEMLSLDGHVVERHYSGEGVLEKVAAFKPELLLMDIGLPGQDGYTIAQSIRAHPEMQTLPIIAISGYGKPADVQRGRAVGIDYHLLKPIDRQRLQQAIDAVMATRRS